MRNQNIAKVLKEYRKRNHLSVNDVSILLEDRSFTAAPKRFTDGKADRQIQAQISF